MRDKEREKECEYIIMSMEYNVRVTFCTRIRTCVLEVPVYFFQMFYGWALQRFSSILIGRTTWNYLFIFSPYFSALDHFPSGKNVSTECIHVSMDRNFNSGGTLIKVNVVIMRKIAKNAIQTEIRERIYGLRSWFQGYFLIFTTPWKYFK